jgi:hypothetical protein
MRKLILSLAALSVAAVASAQILVPNGDFEAGNTGWVEASGGPTFAYETTGGNGGGYASIDATGGEWAVLVNPPEAGNIGGGLDIATIGVTAGATNTFTIDLKTFSGTAGGGMKVEAWAGNALIGNSGDVNAPGANANWTTFTFDWDVPAGTEKMIFVPLWGANSLVGYDNVGVVPEPSTFALLGGLAALGVVMYRRRK